VKSLSSAKVTFRTKVFVRADLDVPVKDGRVMETYRLECLLSTLKYLLSKKAEIVIAGHMGRPKGTFVEELSTTQLKPFFDKNLGEETYTLLENLRFDPRERENDPEFAKELAEKADLYVNECFSSCHREHVSIVGIPKLLPSFAGFHLEKEVSTLSQVLKDPRRPLIAIVGGAKLESKAPAVQKFLESCDFVLVGGKIALEYSQKNDSPNQKLILATDYVSNGLDIGPKTVAKFAEHIKKAGTIVWSGPMGLYEEGHTEGTKSVAQAVLESGAFSVVGGGDTISDLQDLGVLDKFSFVSVGGGALLEFLIKGTLPGLEVLGRGEGA